MQRIGTYIILGICTKKRERSGGYFFISFTTYNKYVYKEYYVYREPGPIIIAIIQGCCCIKYNEVPTNIVYVLAVVHIHIMTMISTTHLHMLCTGFIAASSPEVFAVLFFF